MKKRLFTLVAAALCLASAGAQVTISYDTQVEQSTYEAITDGTVIPLGEGELDAVVFDKTNTAHTSSYTGEGYPIGFDFKFDNKAMNQFFVGFHGYLVLGKDSVSTVAASNLFGMFGSESDFIGFIYRSLVDSISTTEISYKTVGTAPNRELIVQYKDLEMVVDGWSGVEVRDTVQLQFRLQESGNIVMVVSGFEPSEAAAENMNYNDAFRIGIKGTGTDCLLKSGTFDDNSFTTSTSGSLSWRSTSFPADGTTYTFIAPEDCAAPVSQPGNLALTSTTVGISGSFEPASGDHFLVLLSEDATLTALPEDGTFYSAGDSIGNALVVAYTTDSTFATSENLNGASTYYIYVMAANSLCFYGPKYNTASPLTASTATMPLAPESIAVGDLDMNYVTVGVAANEAGNDIIVAYTTEPKMNAYGQALTGGTFGQPAGTYSVGDVIDGGGIVAYVGPATDEIKVEGLTNNTPYHFNAWSRDANGNYSSTYVTASTTTAGIVPWTANFDNMAIYEAPVGWTVAPVAADTAVWNVQSDGSLQFRIYNGDTSNGLVEWLQTPPVYLGEGSNRMIIDLAMSEYSGWSQSAYEFRDNDTLSVQVTENGTDYTTVVTYTKDNIPSFAASDGSRTSNRLTFTFTEAAGNKANVRIYTRFHGNAIANISRIYIEQKPECDYPAEVTVADSTIQGGTAVVTWTPQGDEAAWDVRYKKTEGEEWSTPVTVRERKCTITGLDGNTSYDVQVRARCSATSQSEWSESATFTSGMVAPVSIEFGELESLSSSWESLSGVLATPTEFSSSSRWEFTSGWFSSGLSFKGIDDGNAANEWLLTPVIDLGTDNVNFNASFTFMPNTDMAENSDAVLEVVASKDGETFNAADVLATYDISAWESYEEYSYDVPLKGLSGQIRLGFYLHSTASGMPYMDILTFNVDYTCANDVEAAVDSISDNEAVISWESAAEEWYVFTRKAGETTRNYTTVTEPSIHLTGLDSHTTYEIGITKACEVGDTARAVIVEITTTGADCAMPENVTATPDKWSATIAWQGEASAYNVRYRLAGTEAWATEQVTDTCIVINDLTSSTTYEYAVQAMCSRLEGDTSAYTAPATFTTLAETCLAPESIVVTPSYNSAVVTWDGEADNYEISYRLASEETWTSVAATGTTATITGLTAETAYRLRMRSICAEGDTSRWSSIVDFTTVAAPECVTPTDLTASNITGNSVTLSWTADESNLKWNLRYRASTVTSWTEQLNLETTSYDLGDLTPGTVYVWRVMATCAEGRESSWASQSRFTTADATGIDNIGISSLSIFANGKVLNIVNPEGGLIKSVAVYSTDGRLIGNYTVNTTENVFIPLANSGSVIVKVNGAKQTKTSKMVIK